MSPGLPPLKCVGFWKNEESRHFPEPQWLIQSGWHAEDLDRIVAYLRSGNILLSEMGYSYCRFDDCTDPCARKNGVSDYTDGEWTWPEGLAHYVEKHSVILPEEFISTMRSNHWQVPEGAGLLPAQRGFQPIRPASSRFWFRWVRNYGPWYYRLIYWYVWSGCWGNMCLLPIRRALYSSAHRPALERYQKKLANYEENTVESEQPSVTLTKRDRWVVRLVVTGVLNSISMMLFPAFATDIATPGQLLSCVVPAVWGVYTLFTFRSRKERIVGYVSIILAAFWGFCAGSLAWEHGWRWQW